MHVGYSAGFQNPGNLLVDADVVKEEMRLVDVAVDQGFDSVWGLEHHFTNYFLCPDPLQFLTWVGARHPHIGLGTGVIVLPWHDPVRCAEQIAVLDNFSDGRLILGIGRGIGKVEYEGFRVDMNTSRDRFMTYAELILDGLETGFMEGENQFFDQPRTEIRPRPAYSLRGRTYAAAMSPESMPIMAGLGLGLLVIPQKPWEAVRQDFDSYHQAWGEVHGRGSTPPAPLCAGNVVVHADPHRADELAHRWIGGYYGTVLDHYGFEANAHAGVKGYEYYSSISRHINRRGADGAIDDYVGLMPWGTPDQVIEKIVGLHGLLGMAAFNPTFSFAGMPYPEAEASLRLFAREVLPVIRELASDPLATPHPLGPPRASARVPLGSLA
jgi:alkanesulfonate monooxygenase SsuD/methylene tetrahydromethanopterin reductase-like flavin-dependent oxidoreductase (luciferase family)